MINSLVDALMQRCRPSAENRLIQVSEGRVQSLTPAELWKQSLEKRYFMRSYGMRPGDLWLDHSQGLEQMINLIACLQGSFHYTAGPLPFYQDRKLQTLRVFSQKHRNSTLTCKEIEIPASLQCDDEFSLIVPTRGTLTGQSLPVRLDCLKILHQLETHASAMSLKANARRLITLPGTHSFGLILERLFGLYCGQSLLFVLPTPMHPRSLMRTLDEHSIDCMALVPELMELLLAYVQKHPDLGTSLRGLSLHSGAQVRTREELSRMREQVKEFHWSYGLTECGPGVLLNGKPIGCLIRLEPRSDAQLGPSAGVDELWVATPSLGCFPGRLSKSRDGFFPTGDLVRRHSDQSLEVLGRAEDLIQSSSGAWLDCRAIESELQREYALAGAHLSRLPGSDALRLSLITYEGDVQLALASEASLKQRLGELLSQDIQIARQDLKEWTDTWTARHK